MARPDDNADLIYSQSRSADVKAEQDALVANEMQALEAELAAEEAAAQPDPAADPESPEPSPDEGPGVGTDIARGIARAPIAEGADILDNGLALAKQGLDALGLEGLGAALDPGEGTTLRDAVDNVAGTPDTVPGALAQGLTGQLAYILPAMALVRGAGAVGFLGRNIVAPGTVAALTQNATEGNLSNLATEMGEDTIADNFVTQALAIDDDDTAVERIIKTGIEDMALGFAAEGIGKVVRSSVGAIRAKRAATRAIREAAERSGVVVDDVMTDATDELVHAQAQVDLLEGAGAQLDEGADVAGEAAEQAAFRGDASPADVPPEIQQAVQGQLADARATLAAAEDKVVGLAEEAASDGRVLEALRQSLKDAGIENGRVDEALGVAATRNLPPTPPPKVGAFNNHLEVDADDIRALQQSLDSGDFEGATDSVMSMLDSTNFERIAESGDVTDLLAGVGAMMRGSKQSKRFLTSRTLVQSREGAEARVLELAAESGATPESIYAALDASLPGANLDVQLNTLRIVEVAMAKKTLALSKIAGGSNAGPADKAEFARWAVLTANINDRRAGVVSEIGRALSSLRIDATAGSFDDILTAGRELRTRQIKDVINNVGGERRIAELAEAVSSSVDADTALRQIGSTLAGQGHTVGDTFYNAFIMNILSSPTTQTINFTSNTLFGAVWNPIKRTVDAASLAVLHRDLSEFKAVGDHVQGMAHGFKVALVQNGAFREGSLARAFKTGRRVTAGDEVKFIEDAPTSLLRSEAIGDLVRRGAPLLRGDRAPLFPVPQGARDSIADYLTARTGVGARAIDYIGRVMEYPGKTLAAGDEIAASVSWHAQLKVDATAAGRKLGLEGEELAKHVSRLTNDVGNIVQIAKRTDPRDVVRAEYLQELDRLYKSAGDYARRSTFTQPAGKRLESVMRMRQHWPAMRWFIPFLRTPTNLLKTGVKEFTPAGPLVDLATAGSAEDKAKAAGQLAVTAGFAWGVYEAQQKGLITGGGPHNRAQREIWLKGNTPYSIKTGPNPEDTLQFNRFDPMAMPLGLFVDALEITGHMDVTESDKLWEEIIGVFQNQLGSRSFLEGLSTMAHLLEDPQRYGQRFAVGTVQNTVTPFSRLWATVDRGGLPIPEDLTIPDPGDGRLMAVAKDIARGDNTKEAIQDRDQFTPEGFLLQLGSTIQADLPDPVAEEFAKIWQKVISKKLELSQTATRDFFADIRTLPPSYGPDVASPYMGGIHEGSPLVEELIRLGFGVNTRTMFGEVQGVKLTVKQQDQLQVFFGQPHDGVSIHDLLSKTIFEDDGVTFRDDWLALSDTELPSVGQGSKEDVIDFIVGKRLEEARSKLLAKDPELLEAVFQLKEDKAALKSPEDAVEVRDRRLGITDVLDALQ